MSNDEKTKVKDESNDHIYFTVTPRLVWAMADDPDEYTFWCVVKDIAGEKGECILARDDLAALAMISGGKASQCRDNLINKRLLLGEFKRDPGYPQAVWHLSVPDFWEANTRWARRYPKISDRIDYKKEQLQKLKELRKEASRADGSQKASPDDRGVSPDDERISPDDAKKNVLKNQEEEQKDLIISILKPHGIQLWAKTPLDWRDFEKKIRAATTTIHDGVLTIAGLGLEAAMLEDRLARTFNNYLIVNTSGGFTSLTFQE